MKTKTLRLALGIASVTTGCAGQINSVTAGHIGCAPEEITIYDHHVRWSSSSWVAVCRGKEYYCAGVSGSISCHDAVAGGETEEHAATAAAQQSSAPPPAAGQGAAGLGEPTVRSESAVGCSYDTQCKGDRVCDRGACADPRRLAERKSTSSSAALDRTSAAPSTHKP